jgi:hypothetical protein
VLLREMFAINDAPLFHDRVDLLNIVNVGEGVGIEDDEVGEFAGFQRTVVFKGAAGDSAVFCARDDGLRRRHAEFDEAFDGEDGSGSVVLRLGLWFAGEFGCGAPVAIGAGR